MLTFSRHVYPGLTPGTCLMIEVKYLYTAEPFISYSLGTSYTQFLADTVASLDENFKHSISFSCLGGPYSEETYSRSGSQIPCKKSIQCVSTVFSEYKYNGSFCKQPKYT